MTEEELLQMTALRAGTDPRRRFEDLMGQSLNAQNLAMRQALVQPDTAGLVKLGAEREQLGGEQMMGGMALAGAPRRYASLATPTYGAGLEKQGPWNVGEGWYSGGSYTADPFKRQDRLTKAVQAQAGAGREAAGEYGTEESRKAARAASGAAAAHSAAGTDLIRQQIETGKWIAVPRGEGEGSILVNPATNAIIDPQNLAAGGGGAAGVPGAPGAAPPTMGKLSGEQAKAFNAARRLQSALPILEGALAKGYEPNRRDVLWQKYQGTDVADPILGQLASDEGKSFYGAGRDVLAAMLRKESGAAITNSEWNEFAPLYLPWPTDTPQLRAEKMTRLRSSLGGFQQEAGPRVARVMQMQGAQPAAAGPAVPGARPPSARDRARGYLE